MNTMPPPLEPAAQPSSHTIFERLGRSESAAFIEFVEQYGKWVACLVRRSLGPRCQDFEDAMQEAMLALVRAAPRFDPSRGAPTTFIATVVRRHMISRWHKADRRAVFLSHDPTDDREAGSADSTDRHNEHQLHSALRRLQPQERELLELKIVGGKTPAQIAQTTGLALQTVRRRINRALTQLRRDLTQAREAA
jgi:RNA polymerase sigma-70 factor (ECF subfamily)